MPPNRPGRPGASACSESLFTKAKGPAVALLALALAGWSEPRALDATSNPPIPASYDWRKALATWIKAAFAEPASLRGVRITEPAIIDHPSGATWLVCLEADVKGADGAYLGPRRFAIGFATSDARDGTGKVTTSASIITPDDNRRLAAAECKRPTLVWTAWPGWERTLEPAKRKR